MCNQIKIFHFTWKSFIFLDWFRFYYKHFLILLCTVTDTGANYRFKYIDSNRTLSNSTMQLNASHSLFFVCSNIDNALVKELDHGQI